jgi:hypothetical protein
MCSVCMVEAVEKVRSTAMRPVDLGRGILVTLARGLNRTSERLAVITFVQLGLATVRFWLELGICVWGEALLNDVRRQASDR